ncbi:class III signal peptide-containing protein [Candidatus Micrarchaeota archaeon]|nr:class III signal peptide-containing protein [Candidatus Micrarchaeota archaeon]
MRRGQGTFEYVLLLGGVLLIVVLALVVLTGTFNDTSSSLKEAGKTQCSAEAVNAQACNVNGVFVPDATFSSMSVPEGTRCDCFNFIGTKLVVRSTQPDQQTRVSVASGAKEVKSSFSYTATEPADGVSAVLDLDYEAYERGEITVEPKPSSFERGSLKLTWDVKLDPNKQNKRFDFNVVVSKKGETSEMPTLETLQAVKITPIKPSVPSPTPAPTAPPTEIAPPLVSPASPTPAAAIQPTPPILPRPPSSAPSVPSAPSAPSSPIAPPLVSAPTPSPTPIPTPVPTPVCGIDVAGVKLLCGPEPTPSPVEKPKFDVLEFSTGSRSFPLNSFDEQAAVYSFVQITSLVPDAFVFGETKTNVFFYVVGSKASSSAGIPVGPSDGSLQTVPGTIGTSSVVAPVPRGNIYYKDAKTGYFAAYLHANSIKENELVKMNYVKYQYSPTESSLIAFDASAIQLVGAPDFVDFVISVPEGEGKFMIDVGLADSESPQLGSKEEAGVAYE